MNDTVLYSILDCINDKNFVELTNIVVLPELTNVFVLKEVDVGLFLRAECRRNGQKVAVKINFEHIKLFLASQSEQSHHPFGWKNHKTFLLADPNVFSKVRAAINDWLNVNTQV